MSEMKSAWQIAMEKTEKIEKASPQELMREKEERYAQVAKALAEKLLLGLDGRHWQVEFEKYPAEDRDLLRQKVISHLAYTIEIGDPMKLDRTLSGIRHLKKDRAVQTVEDEIKRLFEEYAQAQQSLRHELDKQVWESLGQLGISGNAIAEVNYLADAEGKRRLQKIAAPYNEKLTRFKRELIL